MFLLHRPTQVLVEILELSDLFDPFKTKVLGMAHAGEELQDPALFSVTTQAERSGIEDDQRKER
jgi:hypothetical protein